MIQLIARCKAAINYAGEIDVLLTQNLARNEWIKSSRIGRVRMPPRLGPMRLLARMSVSLIQIPSNP